MEGKETHHVSEFKKQKVVELADAMKSKTIMIVSIKGLPSAQFQDIKKKLRNKAKIQVAKKSLIDFALDHCGNKELHELVPYVEDSTAILFSDHDAFEISGILGDNKSPAKAKAGDVSPIDIEVKAGPTELLPGPDISALSAVGLIPKVENGKIAIQQDKVIAKEGTTITEALASIMAKLDIVPFEVGLEPVAAFMDGKVYADIKIDKEGTIEALENAYGRVLPFAVEIGYITPETLDFIIAKAGLNGNAIEALIDETATETPKEEKPEEKVEDKEEEVTKEVTEEKTNTEEVIKEEAPVEESKMDDSAKPKSEEPSTETSE